jgi:serine protease
MLALTREYLAPGTDPADQVIVVEFYNKALDHFFMSSNAAEIADLDSGKRAGWERTGLRFRAYDKAVAGAQPVCRFYRSPGFGDSHFYSASASECEAVRNDPVKFPGWTFESASVFYVVVPDQAGACPAGYRPLWRFFRAGVTNHRYTADVSVRDLLRSRSAEWTPEGTGLDAVIMCSQDG